MKLWEELVQNIHVNDYYKGSSYINRCALVTEYTLYSCSRCSSGF